LLTVVTIFGDIRRVTLLDRGSIRGEVKYDSLHVEEGTTSMIIVVIVESCGAFEVEVGAGYPNVNGKTPIAFRVDHLADV
jgi:hypothetical protein